MPLTKPELWKSIEAYAIGSFGAPSDFQARLTAENGWTAMYTSAVVHEYKRFIYALCVSGEALSPSPDIDKAWHLHLVHTQDYWTHFCQCVLGQDIHHQPFSSEDADKRYRRNLRRAIHILTEEFDEAPPSDIWSLNPSRTSQQRPDVDPERFFVVPRRDVLAAAGPLFFGLGVFLLWSHGMVPILPSIIVFAILCLLWLALFGEAKADGDGGSGGGGDGDGGGCGGGD